MLRSLVCCSGRFARCRKCCHSDPHTKSPACPSPCGFHKGFCKPITKKKGGIHV